ncbi:peptide-methionine (S)-S-oxide reductase MsrA [Alterisphingorhabdus coralli]|uniref:Peptide methionine sulfoxide reductase MsrA n=1 Tax=Alterisphingorhabdus coralli TaxID=3071408 RepID=A0AA97F753_9SPHN|nr:peptide-methionine (S)-S-oxide reductase MsrA [Parasphingorhabdus sp. SCSIO 66989]WOE75609.1 peptide-methionine (S)-S-oxide reductase MsrA [Parasphingorhabdus sp. SCSIO 66989]
MAEPRPQLGTYLPRLLTLVLAGGATFGLYHALPAVIGSPAIAAERAYTVPAARTLANESRKNLQVAVFAGGCFWGVEGVFSHVKGVRSVKSGYHGGTKANAKYSLVSRGQTRHAEAVRIVYDPKQVRYTDLLRVFFSVTADPTQLNRQGPDVGRHYRNAIVPLNAEQRRAASAYINQLKTAKIWSKPIVTKVESYNGFYPAETYHQDFMFKNPSHPYIVRWDQPKVRNLKAKFPAWYRRTPVRG